MSRIDQFRAFSVKVASASGCLFQPADDSYTYVLTARHVVEGVDDVKISRQLLDENKAIKNETISIIGQPFFHPDENKDAAIIKVEKVANLPDHLRLDDLLEDRTNYYLCGHPKSRNKDDSYRHNELTISQEKDAGYIEGEIVKAVLYDEIVDQSGGGILKIANSHYCIAGIQKKMTAPDEKETLGRIDFMPLSFYDEIIAANSDELSGLYPPFIKSFASLIEQTYLLKDFTIEGQAEVIRNELHAIADELCDEFNPEEIIASYKDGFLVKGEQQNSIYSATLWTAFLELLILNQLHSDTPISLTDLKAIHKKNKVYYGTVENRWSEIINKIFSADLTEIEKDGSIFITTAGDRTPTQTEFSPTMVAHINKVSHRKMKINSTVQNPSEDLKIKHIYHLQKHIIHNEERFLDADMGTITGVIKHETKDII